LVSIFCLIVSVIVIANALIVIEIRN